MKSLRLNVITAAIALLSIGQPLLLRTFTVSTAAILLSTSKAQAKDASEIAGIAKGITVRIEGATQGSGVLVKKEGNIYTVLTSWHVIKDNRIGEEVGIITSDGKEHLWESESLQRLGKVDMAINRFDELPLSFHQKVIWYDTFSCVMSKTHPLASHYDLDTYLKAQHIWVSKTGFGVGVGIDPNEVQKLGWADAELTKRSYTYLPASKVLVPVDPKEILTLPPAALVKPTVKEASGYPVDPTATLFVI